MSIGRQPASTRTGFHSEQSKTIEWDYHPLLKAVEHGNYSLLVKFLDNEKRKRFGLDRVTWARTKSGQTPILVLLCKTQKTKPKTLYQVLQILLEKFKIDPNAIDNQGDNALMYAVRYGADLEIVKLLLRNGADPKLQNHNQLSGLIYAAAKLRTDVVRLICPDYRAKTCAALQLKFINLDIWTEKLRLSPRGDRLEVPAMLEGSPKRNVFAESSNSPLSGTPINGIRFRVSPCSPASSSSPLSMVVNQPRNSAAETRRTSEDRTNTTSTSKSGTCDVNFSKVMRRVCSATFDVRLFKETSGALQFAQLTHNLCIYLDETDYPFDKTPEPLESEQADVLGDIEEESTEREPRRTSLPAASAPILIKSRSVEDSINKPRDMSAVLIRALPRECRKNALQGGHLIERQGSAPQLHLKRKPRSTSESSDSSFCPSPVSGLSVNTGRQHNLMISPLAVTKLLPKSDS
ncbi:uncharacterized protein LOC129602695 isoform X2 [Paramacrobiotus metropolitanus]|uniref:uncharacterized protein LOC129602695 isoform X2 n=1 Tax=Paramacrobiotus metropolitanus TaxID=2943436 RepID=UPI002445D763|nr:uncharacterized protein LOC129602695 isoform X2 [Paramacrobiotus metropolitanus]